MARVYFKPFSLAAPVAPLTGLAAPQSLALLDSPSTPIWGKGTRRFYAVALDGPWEEEDSNLRRLRRRLYRPLPLATRASSP